MTVLSQEQIDTLRAAVRGEVIAPSDSSYDQARAVYNAMIDKHPALVIRCADVADVIAGVNFARESGLALAVRGGGHNAAGLGTCDDGVVLDLGPIRNVQIDPDKKIARVGGGAVWGDVDHAGQPFGLAVPAGIISTTGVGGLTLGGGFGYLSRGFGLTCDNLISADVVTADGNLVKANKENHPDLFWALRGGGGNFGAVVNFEFRARPVGLIYGGVILFDPAKGRDVFQMYRDFIKDAPREMGMFAGYTNAPPLPFIEEAWHGKGVAKIVFCYNGSEERGNKLIEPFRALGGVGEMTGVMPLSALNSAFDGLFPPGFQDYWKADYDLELTDEMIDIHTQYGPLAPNPNSVMHEYSLNGAIQDVDPDETAYSYRDANFIHVILTEDPDPANIPEYIAWTRDYWNALHPLSAGGAYVNFLQGDEGAEAVKTTYRGNYPRLQSVKKQYDPDNLFRVNQNIKPAS